MAKKEYKKPLVYVQKTGNTKKQYQAPKATVYTTGKSPSPARSRGGISKTLVASAVSILILIGLIATVFLAYDNSQRADGEPFVYFSPANWLERISDTEITVPATVYKVDIKRENNATPLFWRYYGVVDVGGVEFRSTDSMTEVDLSDPNKQFFFYIDGVVYQSYRGVEYQSFYLSLPQMTVDVLEMPDIGNVIDLWSNVAIIEDDDTDVSLLVCLRETGRFIGDYLLYQANLFERLMPWNAVKNSDEISGDGVRVEIPWR